MQHFSVAEFLSSAECKAHQVKKHTNIGRSLSERSEMQSHTHLRFVISCGVTFPEKPTTGAFFFWPLIISPFGYDLKFGAGARWLLGFFTLELAVLERTCCCGVFAPHRLRMYVQGSRRRTVILPQTSRRPIRLGFSFVSSRPHGR